MNRANHGSRAEGSTALTMCPACGGDTTMARDVDVSIGGHGIAAEESFREAIWAEVALMEVWGLSRRSAEVEMYRLTQAIAAVLQGTTLSGSRQREVAERFHGRLCAVLEWPEEEWRQLEESEGPIAPASTLVVGAPHLPRSGV